MEKEFKNEFGKIFSRVMYLESYHAVVVEWHGYTTKGQIEVVTLWIEEFVKTNSCHTILNDCSNIISVWEDSINWFSRIWVQKMKSIGLMSFLHIAREGGFGDKIGKKLGLILTDQVQFCSFKSRPDAMNWLEKNKNSLIF